MRISIFKFCWIIGIYIPCLCLFSVCFNIGERKGRNNPFDPNGENWFPPNIDIVDTVKNISINDSIQIKVTVNDNNGNVNFVKWESESIGFQRTDSITSYEDTTYKSKTTINSYEDSVGITTSIDTSFYNILKDFYYKKHDDTTTYFFVFDTLSKTDTIEKKLSTNSDTSFFKSVTDSDTTPTDSIFIAVKKDSIVYKKVFDTTVTLTGIYFTYTSKFSFGDTNTGSFYLFASAVDNDGLDSEYRDSIRINFNSDK